jgi:ATP-dependent Lon protease
MEVIELHGYTFDEKLRISKTHLVPKQTRAHGLELGQLKITDPALLYICENYTRESGVRSLERTLASVVRSKCVELASLYEERRQHDYNPFVDVEDVKTILGVSRFFFLQLYNETIYI